jgi:hypothetical protein
LEVRSVICHGRKFACTACRRRRDQALCLHQNGR